MSTRPRLGFAAPCIPRELAAGREITREEAHRLNGRGPRREAGARDAPNFAAAMAHGGSEERSKFAELT